MSGGLVDPLLVELEILTYRGSDGLLRGTALQAISRIRSDAATITALQAEVERLREALATYAGTVDDTWNEKPFPYWANGYPGGVFIADNTLDFGETARAALERTKP